MNIATALNKKYIPYTTTMLLSLAMNNREDIEVYILSSELDDEDIALITEVLSPYNVKIYSITIDRKLFGEKLPVSEQWSIEMYYRLMLCELLPLKVERILYLDGDLIVNKSIREFYHKDFENNEIIACFDKGGLNTADRYSKKNNEMFAEAYSCGYKYFNSGVMLMNIEKMRTKYSLAYYLDAMEKWDYKMEAPDQDILNWVHWKNVGYVDYKVYDLFSRVAHNQGMTYADVMRDVAIIHFAGYKPWESSNFHYDIEKIWWEYAKCTPFYTELLEEYIIQVLRDKTVKKYLDDLQTQYEEKNELLKKTMAVINKVLGKLE